MAKRPRKRKRTPRKSVLPLERRQKIVAALSIFIGALVLVSLFSHSDFDDKRILDGSVELFSLKESSQLVDNRGGVIGAYFSLALNFFVGWGAFLAPLWLFLGGVALWKPRALNSALKPMALYSLVFILILTLLDNAGEFSSLAKTGERSALEILSGFGGALSLKMNYLALRYLGGIGSTLALLALTIIVTLIALPRNAKLDSAPEPLKAGARKAGGAAGSILSRIGSRISLWKERRHARAVSRAEEFVVGARDEDNDTGDRFESRLRSALSERGREETPRDSFEGVTELEPFPDADSSDPIETADSPSFPIPNTKTPTRKPRQTANNASSDEPDDDSAEQTTLELGDYEFPHLGLLDDPPRRSSKADEEELTATARELRETLGTFGVKINGEVMMYPGPVVTRYEFRPAQGVKVNQILNLSDDLALALRAKRIRIVAPIPGKAAVGIEVPVRKREMVYLKDILKSPKFSSPDIKLPLAFGKTISGDPFIGDLTKMPHLLIAGATGAGKSVCINVIISSLLYRLDPSELRFLFIDPKMLELSIYSGIPHLERPVVTNPRKAERVLADAVVEMEDRYKKLATHGVRSIAEFNKKMADEPMRKIPYLVIVIDELADLMMSQTSAKTEVLITRLAQMARAVGIHLILATQRPSVDVITGLIKANFPSRVAFHVASKTDSRTILDANGAEKLLGQGDMLFQWAGQPELVRLHGAFISGEETEQIVSKIKVQQVEVARIENVSKEISEEDLEASAAQEKVDPIYLEAVETVLHHKQASVSLLQRRLGIGYQRAARIIDRLEEGGIIGPYDGSKARQVLVDQSYLETLKGASDRSAEQLAS